MHAVRPVPSRDSLASVGSPLIVHSHLRWDFVWQRPQQLLSRFAEKCPVLFIEEPIVADDVTHARLDLTTPTTGLTRAVPLLPRQLNEHYDVAIAEIRDLVRAELAGGSLAGRFEKPLQWFYTPMPAPAMLGAVGERGVVYDCMDELSQFRGAPPELQRRERLLLAAADIVFTGGYQLWRVKSRYHDRVHFFGCGVDAAHFSRARRAETPVPAELASLPRPVFGYYGVIDERLDYELLRALAAARPDASLALVGPVAKVDPAILPRGANIHWLGQRSYAELPAIVKGFDVCLMPFALNEATEYINPTKTLEYMAAGKPIVSTAVADVVRNFTPIVDVAHSQDEFIDLVGRAATHPDLARLGAGVERAERATWEAIVSQMRVLIAEAIAAPDREAESRETAAPGRRAVETRGAPPRATAVGD